MPVTQRQVSNLVKAAPANLRADPSEYPADVIAAVRKVLTVIVAAERLELAAEQKLRLARRLYEAGVALCGVIDAMEAGPRNLRRLKRHGRDAQELLTAIARLLGVSPQHLQAGAAEGWDYVRLITYGDPTGRTPLTRTVYTKR